MQTVIDILENEMIEKYPNILNTLLFDHTTQKNIFWATNNYAHLGEDYQYKSPITAGLITGDNGRIITPRVHKKKALQQSRSKEMAEVFTPSWVCNAQNNLVDNSWFGREGVFNKEKHLTEQSKKWETNKEKIIFPEGKTWEDYIAVTCLEITCGEAPYVASRYDTTTGDFISIEDRIGLLDRKLRVVNENTDTTEEWFAAAEKAYQHTYAFEWQGDSLLLAREAILITFVEYHTHKFGFEPSLEQIQKIANIVSWNVWQMDGLKGVVPNSCTETVKESNDLFGNHTKQTVKCKGCESKSILLHNGTHCKIMDWDEYDNEANSKGKTIRFIDLINPKA